jgi:hypothetical protein
MIKKILVLGFAAVMAVASIPAQEKGDMAVGGNLSLGTGYSFTNIGIITKFQYNVTSPIRLEGAFNYFLKKNMTSMRDLGVNGYYLSVSVPDFGYGMTASMLNSHP